jgi:hypothetical protein
MGQQTIRAYLYLLCVWDTTRSFKEFNPEEQEADGVPASRMSMLRNATESAQRRHLALMEERDLHLRSHFRDGT